MPQHYGDNDMLEEREKRLVAAAEEERVFDVAAAEEERVFDAVASAVMEKVQVGRVRDNGDGTFTVIFDDRTESKPLPSRSAAEAVLAHRRREDLRLEISALQKLSDEAAAEEEKPPNVVKELGNGTFTVIYGDGTFYVDEQGKGAFDSFAAAQRHADMEGVAEGEPPIDPVREKAKEALQNTSEKFALLPNDFLTNPLIVRMRDLLHVDLQGVKRTDWAEALDAFDEDHLEAQARKAISEQRVEDDVERHERFQQELDRVFRVPLALRIGRATDDRTKVLMETALSLFELDVVDLLEDFDAYWEALGAPLGDQDAIRQSGLDYIRMALDDVADASGLAEGSDRDTIKQAWHESYMQRAEEHNEVLSKRQDFRNALKAAEVLLQSYLEEHPDIDVRHAIREAIQAVNDKADKLENTAIRDEVDLESAAENALTTELKRVFNDRGETLGFIRQVLEGDVFESIMKFREYDQKRMEEKEAAEGLRTKAKSRDQFLKLAATEMEQAGHPGVFDIHRLNKIFNEAWATRDTAVWTSPMTHFRAELAEVEEAAKEEEKEVKKEEEAAEERRQFMLQAEEFLSAQTTGTAEAAALQERLGKVFDKAADLDVEPMDYLRAEFTREVAKAEGQILIPEGGAGLQLWGNVGVRRSPDAVTGQDISTITGEPQEITAARAAETQATLPGFLNRLGYNIIPEGQRDAEGNLIEPEVDPDLIAALSSGQREFDPALRREFVMQSPRTLALIRELDRAGVSPEEKDAILARIAAASDQFGNPAAVITEEFDSAAALNLELEDAASDLEAEFVATLGPGAAGAAAKDEIIRARREKRQPFEFAAPEGLSAGERFAFEEQQRERRERVGVRAQERLRTTPQGPAEPTGQRRRGTATTTRRR